MNEGPTVELNVRNDIPPRDSKQFVVQLLSPDFEGRKPFKDYLVGKLKGKIEQKLLSTTHPVIGFSDQPYTGNDAIEFSMGTNGNGRYTLNDSSAFFLMLDQHPETFQVDCLNVVPILIIDTLREVLIERGYTPEAVDEKLTGMIFNGAASELLLNGQLLKPLSFVDEVHSDDDGRQYTGFSQRRKGLKAKADYTDEGAIMPETVELNQEIEPGDIVYSNNAARSSKSDFGNGDSQTGIVLNKVESNKPNDPVTVFAHRTNPADRSMTFGGVLKLIEDNAVKSGMSLPEYIIRGGANFDIVTFDYVGFYAAFAQSLSQTKP